MSSTGATEDFVLSLVVAKNGLGLSTTGVLGAVMSGTEAIQTFFRHFLQEGREEGHLTRMSAIKFLASSDTVSNTSSS